jgi:hypothetical protein
MILAVAGFGMGGYVYFASEQELAGAIAEADRLDSGWRFDEIEAARANVPDAENSALLVAAAFAKMPAKWTAPSADDTPHITERLADLPPEQPLTLAQLQEARTELAKVAAALATARPIADYPRGRWSVRWQRHMLIATLVPHLEQPQLVVYMLVLDATVRCAEGGADGAMRSCQAALNVGRSVGDEPSGVSQIVRRARVRDAVRALERVMAQTEPSDRALAAMQRLLADEVQLPALLIFARSERAMLFDALDSMRTEQVNRAAFMMKPSRLGARFDTQRDRFLAHGAEAAFLRHGTQVVEIAKLPSQDQEERLRQVVAPTHTLPPLLGGLMGGNSVDWVKWARNFHRAQATVRCAETAMAAERYRLAEQQWPADLNALVPRYLAAVPADPFDGQPLRLRRLPDGIVIYSVGPDRSDDDGKLDRSNAEAPSTDVGFQLWDADRRVARAPPD